MEYKYAISFIVKNTLEILQRVSIVFSRNRLFILRLNFEPLTLEGNFVFNLETYSNERTIERVIRQLYNIFELLEITITNRILM